MSKSPSKKLRLSMKEVFDLHQDKPLTDYKVSVVPSTLKNGKIKRGQPYLLGNFLGMTEKKDVGPDSETNYTLTFKHPDGRTLTNTSMGLDSTHDFYKIILESPKSTHQYPIDSNRSHKTSKSRSASRSPSASRKTQSHSGGRRRSKRSRKLRR